MTNLYSNQEQDVGDAARWTIFVFLPAIWLIPCIIFTVVIAFLTGLAFLPPGWMAAPIAALFAAYSIDRGMRKQRIMQARTVLGYLDHAVRLNLPLVPFLLAAQESERGVVRRQIAHLRDSLQAGYPLGTSLHDALPELPAGIAATLAAAEPIGQFQPTLARIVDADRAARPDDDTERSPYNRFYPLGMLLMLASTLFFFMVFIVPKFREIFKDFRTSLPWMTEIVMEISSFVGENLAVLLLCGFLIFLAIFGPMSYYLHRIFLPFWRLPPVGGTFEFLRWWAPILHGVERDRGMSITSEFLAQATGAGVPLPIAVERALHLPTNTFFRAKLRRWADHLDAGEAPDSAARKAGLPDLLAGFLGPGKDNASLPSMFAFLARYYRHRFSRSLILLRAAAEPLIVLFFGTLVCIFTTAVILPIVKLLNSVMGVSSGGYL